MAGRLLASASDLTGPIKFSPLSNKKYSSGLWCSANGVSQLAAGKQSGALVDGESQSVPYVLVGGGGGSSKSGLMNGVCVIQAKHATEGSTLTKACTVDTEDKMPDSVAVDPSGQVVAYTTAGTD